MATEKKEVNLLRFLFRSEVERCIDQFDEAVIRRPEMRGILRLIPKEWKRYRVVSEQQCALCQELRPCFHEEAWFAGAHQAHLCPACWSGIRMAGPTETADATSCALCNTRVPGEVACTRVAVPSLGGIRTVCQTCADSLRQCRRCARPLPAAGRSLCKPCFVDSRLGD